METLQRENELLRTALIAAITAAGPSKPPTTAWGALLVAAKLLELSAGLARLDTIQADYRAGKLEPFSALQEALWPPPEDVPRRDGGIPKDKDTGRPYWAAVRLLDLGLGGTGDLWSPAIDKLLVDPESTAASVAAAMRRAAGSPATNRSRST